MVDKVTQFEEGMPITFSLSMLSKQYLGVMFKKLSHVGIEKYYTAMMLIEKANGKLSQQKLADQLLIDKASVVRMIDYLVDREFITRQQNPDDRREHFLVLTGKARQAMSEIKSAVSQLNEAVFSEFTDEEKKQFWRAIRKINTTLSALPSDEVLFEYDPTKTFRNQIHQPNTQPNPTQKSSESNHE